MKASLVIPLLILLASQATAQIVLDEHFTDGTLSFGSDPNDGNFLRQGGTSQSISIATDNIIGAATRSPIAIKLMGPCSSVSCRLQRASSP